MRREEVPGKSLVEPEQVVPRHIESEPVEPEQVALADAAISRLALNGLMGILAVMAMSFGAVFALIADLQDRIKFADWGLGAIVAASFLVNFVSQVSLARYADRGKARLLLLAGVVLAAVGMAGFALATNLWLLIGARSLMGFGAGTFLPAARRVVVADAAGHEGRLLARLESANVAGFIAGPPVAAALSSTLGVRAPFLVLALALVVVTPALLAVREPGSAPVQPPRRVSVELLRSPGVRAGLAIGAGLYTTIGVFETLWARYLTDLGASTAFIGGSLLLFGLPMVLGMPLGGRFADRVGPRRAGLSALACGLPLLVLYGQTTSLVALCAIAVIHACIDSVTTPAGVAAVSRAAPPGLTAAGQGMYGATTAIAAGLSAVAIAPIYGWASAPWAWLATAGMVAACLFGGLIGGGTPEVRERRAGRAGHRRAGADEPASPNRTDVERQPLKDGR